MTQKRLLPVLGITALCIAIVAIGGYLIASQWRVVAFTPACKIYDDPPEPLLLPVFDQLHFLDGETSEEFRREVAHAAPKFLEWVVIDPETVEVGHQAVYTTMSAYLNFMGDFKKYRWEREEWFHAVSQEAVRFIFERRQAEGRFDGIDMAPYKVSYPDLAKNLIPDQCGFMEELIMKGGRFASE